MSVDVKFYLSRWLVKIIPAYPYSDALSSGWESKRLRRSCESDCRLVYLFHGSSVEMISSERRPCCPPPPPLCICPINRPAIPTIRGWSIIVTDWQCHLRNRVRPGTTRRSQDAAGGGNKRVQVFEDALEYPCGGPASFCEPQHLWTSRGHWGNWHRLQEDDYAVWNRFGRPAHICTKYAFGLLCLKKKSLKSLNFPDQAMSILQATGNKRWLHKSFQLNHQL